MVNRVELGGVFLSVFCTSQKQYYILELQRALCHDHDRASPSCPSVGGSAWSAAAAAARPCDSLPRSPRASAQRFPFLSRVSATSAEGTQPLPFSAPSATASMSLRTCHPVCESVLVLVLALEQPPAILDMLFALKCLPRSNRAQIPSAFPAVWNALQNNLR